MAPDLPEYNRAAHLQTRGLSYLRFLRFGCWRLSVDLHWPSSPPGANFSR